MILEGLVPGVQHGDDSEGSVKTCLGQTQVTFHSTALNRRLKPIFLWARIRPVEFMRQGKH